MRYTRLWALPNIKPETWELSLLKPGVYAVFNTEAPDKLPPYEAWVQLAIEREEIAALLETANGVEQAALISRLETVNEKSAALEAELLPGEGKGKA